MTMLSAIAALPPGERDAALEEQLGIAGPVPSTAPGPERIGYLPGSVASIVRSLIEVPVVADDVVIDIGSGLGKVVMVARMLTGAAARGVELQRGLVERSRQAAERLGLDVSFVCGDAVDVDLSDGTVFFLYLPFTGRVMRRVVERLRDVAEAHAIVVCCLGFDLEEPWLRPRRAVDAFWLTIYDSVLPNVPPRGEKHATFAPEARAIAHERDLSPTDQR